MQTAKPEKCRYCHWHEFRIIEINHEMYRNTQYSIKGGYQCLNCYRVYQMEWGEYKSLVPHYWGGKHHDDDCKCYICIDFRGGKKLDMWLKKQVSYSQACIDILQKD